MRHLSYCRIIDCDKHFELTQCFSSQNLLIFCCKWEGLLVALQIENLEGNWDSIWFIEDTLLHGGARPVSSRLYCPWGRLQVRGLLLHLFRMETRSLPCRFCVQCSFKCGPAPVSFLFENHCLLYRNWERNRVLQGGRDFKRLYESYSLLITHTDDLIHQYSYSHQRVLLLRCLLSCLPFGDGKLNLLPTSACLYAFQQLCIYLLKDVLQSCGLVSLFCTWSDLGRVVWPELDIQLTIPCLVLAPLLLSEVWLEVLLM